MTDADDLRGMIGAVENWRRRGGINLAYAGYSRRRLEYLRRSPDLDIQRQASALLIEVNAMIRVALAHSPEWPKESLE